MALPKYFVREDIAKMVGVTQTTVNQWYLNGLPRIVIPKSEDPKGGYRTKPREFVGWYKNYIEEQAFEKFREVNAAADQPRYYTLEDEKHRLTKESADGKALENAKMRGELGEIAAFRQAHMAAMTIYGQGLAVDLPDRLAVRLASMRDKGQISAYLQHEMDEAIQRSIQHFLASDFLKKQPTAETKEESDGREDP